MIEEVKEKTPKPKQYLSTGEVGLRLGLSTWTVRQKFSRKPGVLVVTRGSTRTHYRIPVALVEAYEAKHILKPKPSRRRV
jgi:hypothetical protein